MNAHERKVEMLRRKVRAIDIARKLGLSSQHVSLVISGRTTSARVQSAVAEALGMAVETVFPPRTEDAAA